jgi:ATP-dependent HslUV protease subunit HslV
MTTIAYRDGVLAGDTSVWNGDTCVARGVKVWKLADGRLVGCAGHVPTCQQFHKWLSGTGDKPALPPSENGFKAIVIDPQGDVVFWGETLESYDLEGPFFAIGAGTPLALAAMMAGADAQRAVEIAAELHDATRLPVITVRLDHRQ